MYSCYYPPLLYPPPILFSQDNPTGTPTDFPTEFPTEAPSPTETETLFPTVTETPLPSETPTLAETATETPTDGLIEIPVETATLGEAATETATASPTLPVLPTEAALPLLFNDTFDSGDLSLWTLGKGWGLVASESGQALQVNGSDEAVTLAQGTLGDSAAQMRFVLNTGAARLSLRQSEAGAYTLLLDMNGNVSLYRGDQLLGTALVNPKPVGEWRTLRLSAVGDMLRAAVDGVEVIAVQDAAPLPPGTLSFGGVGLAEGALRVDDVAVLGALVETSISLPTITQPFANLAEQPPINLLFRDNFNLDSIIWTSSNPLAAQQVPSIKGNSLRIFVNNPSIQLSQGQFLNIAAQASIQILGGTAQVNVRQSNVGYYRASLNAEGKVQLFKSNLLLQTVIVNLGDSSWHTLRLSVFSNTVRVAVNAAEVITFIDDNPLPTGNISFSVGDAGMFLVDDFELWGAEGETPIPLPVAPQANNSTNSSGAFTNSFATPLVAPSSSIAFVDSIGGGTNGISILDPANPLNPFNATNNPADDRHPALSRDGTQLAFVSDRDNNSFDEIYILSGNNYVTRQLVNSGFSPVWSPDGTKIAFIGSDNRIYTVNSANGSGLQQIPTPVGSILELAWSAGSKIAYIYYVGPFYGLRSVDVNTFVDQDIRNHPNAPFELSHSIEIYLGDWSTDGRLVFSPGSSINGFLELLIYNDLTGSFNSILMPLGAGAPRSSHWSPDNSKIGFYYIEFNSGFPQGISTINPDGTGLQHLFPLSHVSEIDWSNPFPPPLPTCIYDAVSVTYFRAPITFNPKEGNLTYSSPYNFVADQKFIDYKGIDWRRISRVELDTVPGTNVDAAVANAIASGKGGLWVPVSLMGTPIGGNGCNGGNGLPTSTVYPIQNPTWAAPTSVGWPIDVSTFMCQAATIPKEIHALGIQPAGVSYPQATHTGIDLFVPDNLTNVPVKSIASGIVVGIGKNQDNLSHAYWGASTVTSGPGGWSVIIRHGYIYALYGHLGTLDNNIWVGKTVNLGTILGTVGKFNQRHLHLEIHSYGATIATGIGPTNAAIIDSTGILPINVTAQNFVAPHFYDPLQLLPNPPGYSTALNNGLSVRDLVATFRLVPSGNEGQAAINFVSGCTFIYRTRHPAQSNVIQQVNANVYDYRGFVGYTTFNQILVSPLTQTQPPH